MESKCLLLLASLMFLSGHKPLWSQAVDSQDAAQSEKARTRDDQLRQIQIDKAKLDMELAKKLMEKKEVELKNLKEYAPRGEQHCDRARGESGRGGIRARQGRL